MRRGILAALLGLLTSASPMLAQAPSAAGESNSLLIVVNPASGPPAAGATLVAAAAPPVAAGVPPAAAPVQGVPTIVGPEDVFWSAPPPHASETGLPCGTVWLNADYLLWWIRQAPIAAPLVTTGSPLDAVPGALGQNNTAVLFGNNAANLGAFSGFRVSLGFAFAEGWMVEGTYFGLETRVVGQSFQSDAGGNPVIARPYFDNQTGAPAAYLDSSPGLLAGGATVAIDTRLFGYEANVGTVAYRDESMRFDLLVGFRALELDEQLQISDNVAALVPGVLTFLGAPADPPNSLTILDRLHNYNRFYGGQIGGRFHWLMNGLDLGVTAKLALGATDELARIDSATNLNTPGVGQTSNPGGVLVQPSNAGFFTQCRFAYVPELALDMGYWVCPHVRLEVGYQFLYWSEVARPGSEIDLNVNPAQVPRDPRFGSGLGAAQPAFQFHQSDFWAQGFHFGVLLQY
jgi:hypothetical protein